MTEFWERKAIKETVLLMWQQGEVVGTIADELGIDKASVMAVLLRENAATQEELWGGKGPAVVLTDKGTAARMTRVSAGVIGETVREGVVVGYKAGKGPADLAEEYDLAVDDVWQILGEEGVPVARIKVAKLLGEARLEAEVCSLYEQGVVCAEIEKRCGITGGKRKRILRDHGIPLRGSEEYRREKEGLPEEPEEDVTDAVKKGTVADEARRAGERARIAYLASRDCLGRPLGGEEDSS